MYNLEAMENAVKKCDVNIETFELAIDKELETKREYQRIVKELKAREV